MTPLGDFAVTEAVGPTGDASVDYFDYFWLNLQAQYDLDRGSDRLGDRLEREVTAHAS